MKKEFILTVEGVNKEFDGFKAITDLNFYLDRGEMRVIIGPNGAGKSTFFDLLTGRTKPDTGKIEFGRSTDLTALNEYEINRLGIGRKFQTPSVYVDHTVFENLLLSLKGPRGVFATLFHRTTAAQRARIDELLQLIRLGPKRDLRAGQLAHGEKQWLEIGMLLAQDPQVLLVDEPAAGMTDEETHRTGELLISLAGRHSLIVVEHDMTFVRQIAQDRKITVLHQGTVLCEGRFEQVQADPQVRAVYLGRGKSAPMSALLQLSGVEADIGGSRILRGVDLEVAAGEVVCLMGRNGVGKTTTLRVIMGLRAARAGSVTFDGRSLNHVRTAERAHDGIAYVPQGRDIFPHLTVEENLRVGILLHARPRAAIREELDRVYTLFPVLKAMLARKGGVLSGGQQQQLAIARALLTRPKLLMLDEPTEGIQPSIIDEIGDTLKRLRQDGGLAILLVEQFVDFCREVGDRFYAMDRGSITISGAVAGLTDDIVRQHLQV